MNRLSDNLRAYGKLVGSMDMCRQATLWQSKRFLRLTQGQSFGGAANSKVKANKATVHGPLQTSMASHKKKRMSKGKSHILLDLPPTVSTTSSLQGVFPRTDHRERQGLLPKVRGVGDLRHPLSKKQQSATSKFYALFNGQ